MERKSKYKIKRKDAIEKWASKYPRVMTWLSKLQNKDYNAFNLWRFCDTMGKNPDELLAMKENPQSLEAEYLLDQFVADKKIPFTNSVKVNIVTSVKSFFKHNYRDLARASGQISLEKVKPYRKHTKDELLKIYRACSNPRDRALITFVWSTSIAKESLTKIKWHHLDEDWKKQEIPHIGLPDKLIKGHGRGRYRGVEQHTFLTPEAKRDLLEYKEWAERIKGVEFKPDSPIFVNIYPPFEALSYKALGGIHQRLSKQSGVLFSWHDARRYVETALEESKIHPNWARKIRGRKVRGEEAPYSRPAIEQLRNAYREAVPLLEFTQPTQLMELQNRQELVERLQQKNYDGIPWTEEERRFAKQYRIGLAERPGPMLENTEQNGGSDCQKIVSEDELEQYLTKGWRVEAVLPSGKVVISNER